MENVDRREHPRFPLILAVQYLDHESAIDRTGNLSASGLFIHTEREFHVGERVGLLVSFPQLEEPVEMEVEVVRIRSKSGDLPAGVGVRLLDETGERVAQLKALSRPLVADHLSDPAPRVLVVEDNALLASMYANALRRSCLESRIAVIVETAGDGDQAFERLMHPPHVDLVVTDVYMPVSGLHLLEAMRAEPSLAATEIVVISSGDDAVRDAAAALGVTTFLRKPVHYEDFASAVRKVLSQSAERLPAAPGGEAPQGELTPEGRGHKNTPEERPAFRR